MFTSSVRDGLTDKASTGDATHLKSFFCLDMKHGQFCSCKTQNLSKSIHLKKCKLKNCLYFTICKY